MSTVDWGFTEIRAEVWTSITPPLEMSTRPGKVNIHVQYSAKSIATCKQIPI
jgi:hypothetical protein